MVEMYFANVGAGKTTYLVKRAIEEIKRIENGKSKYKYVIGNFNANIENYIYIEDIREVLKHYVIEDALLLIDEASIEYNNRKMNMTTQEIKFFKLHRHYNVDIIIVSQSYEDVDITLRRLVDRMYQLKKLGPFTVIKSIRKKISIDNNTKQIIDEFYYNKLDIKIFVRSKYYKYFNSYEKPKDMKIYNIEVKK